MYTYMYIYIYIYIYMYIHMYEARSVGRRIPQRRRRNNNNYSEAYKRGRIKQQKYNNFGFGGMKRNFRYDPV